MTSNIIIIDDVCDVCNKQHIYHNIGWILDNQKKYEFAALAFYEFQYSFSPECSQTSVFNIAHILRYTNRERSLQLLKTIVDDDDVLCLLGNMYRLTDHNEALMWYNKGRDKGHPPCICGIGEMYYSGIGVNKDLSKAYNYFIEAAKMLYYPAINRVIHYYRKGIGGVEKSEDKQAEWLEKIPKKHLSNVQKYNLGWYYIKKSNNIEKKQKGLQIMRELIDDYEDHDAMYLIGENYEKEKNSEFATKWYKRSAELGDYDSCVKMIICTTGEEHLKYLKKAIRKRNEKDWGSDVFPHPLYSDENKLNVEVGALKNIIKDLDKALIKIEQYEMRPPIIGGKLFREARERFNKIKFI